MKTMRKIEFDELQQSKRDRYGYQSFMLLAFLIMIDNVFYGIGIVWAQHPVNTFILLLTSFAYFISRSIWGDALVGPKETPAKVRTAVAVVVLIAAVAAILAVGYISSYMNLKLSAEDGSGSLLTPYCIAMWAVIGIVYLAKKIRDHKMD